MLRRICKLVIVSFIFLPSLVGAALVNINTALSPELQTLSGIGPTYAQRIIDYRVAHGSFQRIDDIKNVSGIGDATFTKIKDYITVGDTSSALVTSTTTDTVTTTSSDISTSNISGDLSSHYSSVPLSEKLPEIKITATAGRERLGSVGSPLEFQANTNLIDNPNIKFFWNFGDGTTGEGERLDHVYEYAGDYVVMLNIDTPQGKAASRTNVKIVEPNLAISDASPEKISIKNNSQYELNLFGRALISNGRTFIFPQDTIIKAEQILTFSNKVTGLSPRNTLDVAVITLGSPPEGNLNKVVEEKRQAEIRNIEQKLALIETQLAVAYRTYYPKVPTSTIATSSNMAAVVVSRANFTKATSSNGWVKNLKSFLLRKQ